MTNVPRTWVWWRPGESEDALLGFVSRAERDAYVAGDAGRFKRIIRITPKSFEATLIRTYLEAHQ